MNGTLSFFGRGLLVLALTGFAVACGDDDDGGNRDAGDDAGGGTGGTGGTGGGGTGGDSDSGVGLTPAQCEAMAFQTPGTECLACVCAEDPDTTVACEEGCWGLVQCVGSECGGDGTNVMCITTACVSFLALPGAMSQAIAFTPAIEACADVCAAPDGDGGTDDGGT